VSRYIYSGAETVSVYDASTTWKQDFVFGQVIDEVLMLEQADVVAGAQEPREYGGLRPGNLSGRQKSISSSSSATRTACS
jgi:hypothetical protein